MRKELYQAIKKGNVLKFYKSPEWKLKRKEALVRDHNECVRHKAKGKFAEAVDVHHKKHIKDYPELALDLDNLESLCISCHNYEHPNRFKKYIKKVLLTEERW